MVFSAASGGAVQRQAKPKDVEEAVDYYLHRPLAALLVNAVARTSVTPNQITVASSVVGLLAGGAVVLSAFVGSGWMAAGAALLLFSVVLDCADGQLARLRGESSLVGRALDGLADVVAPLAVFHGMAIYLTVLGFSPWLVWPVGYLVGASFSWHTVLYDHAKNLYLLNTQPPDDHLASSLVDLERIDAEIARHEAAGERGAAWVVRAFRAYTVRQRRRVSALERRATPLAESDEEREMYRQLFRPLMRLSSLLGLGTHMFGLTAACLLALWTPYAIWAAWALYLLPLNLLGWWAPVRRARLTTAFLARRDALRQARAR